MQNHNYKFEYLIKDHNCWPLVLYSPSLNVVISTISKNASCAIELWAKSYDFQTLGFQDQDLISISEKPPKFITVLRDPVERAISAIHMLQLQHKRFGLEVTWGNYRCLEYAYEPHLSPQSAFIPTKPLDIESNIDCSSLWDHTVPNKYPRGWTDVLEEYDTISRITDDNIFFYAHEDQDVTIPMTKYLNLPHRKTFIKQNAFERYGESKPRVFEDYKDYLKKVYEYDYKLIDSVKFVNK